MKKMQTVHQQHGEENSNIRFRNSNALMEQSQHSNSECHSLPNEQVVQTIQDNEFLPIGLEQRISEERKLSLNRLSGVDQSADNASNANQKIKTSQNIEGSQIVSGDTFGKQKNQEERSTKKPDLPPQSERKLANGKKVCYDENCQKQCRICLENQSEGRLIRPCVCIGSINHVHQKCIKEWILRKTDSRGRRKIHCQVCDFEYKYKVSRNRQISCQEYSKNKQHNLGTFRCFYIVMAILLMGLAALVGIVIISAQDTPAGQNLRKSIIYSDSIRVIYACVCFLYFNIYMFAIILFVTEYGVRMEISIENVLDISQIGQKKKNLKIYPKAKQPTV